MTRVLFITGGVIAPATAIALAVVASSQEPGYSPVADHLSGLSSTQSSVRWVMTVAFSVAGTGVMAVGVALSRVTGRAVTISLFFVAGASTLLVGVIPRSCVEVACADPGLSHRLHDAFSVPVYLSLIALPLLVTARTELELSRRASAIVAGLTAILAGVFAADLATGWNGLLQRAFVVIPLGWLVVTAARLARHPPANAATTGAKLSASRTTT